MIFLNIDDCQPNKDWLDRAKILTDQLIASVTEEERAKIINDNSGMWSELKQQLKDVLKRKCWYSESINDFAHCHVDHFRPKTNAIDEDGNDKGGYWWLAFDWTNYRYSAPAGNIRKKDYFHVNLNKANKPTDAIENEDIRFLDPTEPGDPEKLSFNNEGIISPRAKDNNSRDYIQAEYTIRRMNLNMEGLMEEERIVIGRLQ